MIAGIMENADDVAGNILGVKHARGRKNDIMDCNEVDMEWVNRIMKQWVQHLWLWLFTDQDQNS